MQFKSARAWSFGVVAVGVAGCATGDGQNTGSSSADIVSCAGSVVEGIDVSYYDGTVDWNSVKASGRQFAIARVSDGTGFMDPKFSTYWSGIKAAGMIRGVYQFFRPEDDAVAQANIVISGVGSLGPGDLPPVLDVEVSDGQSSATILNGINTWVAQIESKLGVEPMIYVSPGFWNGLSGTSSVKNTWLWVANWGVSCPSLPSTWTSFKFWQYSDTGSVPGMSSAVDLDRYNGTLAELQAFAAGGGGGGGGGSSGTGAAGTSGSGGGGSSGSGSGGGSGSGSGGGSGSGAGSGGAGGSGGGTAGSGGGGGGGSAGTGDAGSGGYAFVRPRNGERRYDVAIAAGRAETVAFTWHEATGAAPPADLTLEAGGQPMLQVVSIGSRPFVRAGLDVAPLEPDARYRISLTRSGDTLHAAVESRSGAVVLAASAVGSQAALVLPSAFFRASVASDLP